MYAMLALAWQHVCMRPYVVEVVRTVHCQLSCSSHVRCISVSCVLSPRARSMHTLNKLLTAGSGLHCSYHFYNIQSCTAMIAMRAISQGMFVCRRCLGRSAKRYVLKRKLVHTTKSAHNVLCRKLRVQLLTKAAS
jgi:hypothetical protein